MECARNLFGKMDGSLFFDPDFRACDFLACESFCNGAEFPLHQFSVARGGNAFSVDDGILSADSLDPFHSSVLTFR